MARSESPCSTSSSAGYKPSLLLCYTLVYWNAFCLFVEITTLTYLPLIYIPITYAPTFYFALQSTRAHAQGLDFDPESFKSLSRWTITLASIWCLAMTSHVYFWWSATMWRDAFLVPLYATCQPTFIMVYIAARYMIHWRNTRSSVFLSNDEENASNAAIHNDLTESVHQEGNNTTIHYVDDTVHSEDHTTDAMAGTHYAVFELYRPSIFLSLVSISLVISTTVIDILQYDTQFIYLIVIALWLQPCIFIVSIQLYIVFRNVRDPATDRNFTTSANLTFECTIVWLSTRLLAVVIAQGKYQWLSTSSISGAIETGLLLYFSVRYTSSLLRVTVLKDQIVIGNDPTSDTATTTSRPPSNSLALFQPPIYLLAGCIFFCILCIRRWIVNRMFILDYPSIFLAYVPTIVVYAYSIFQTTRPSHADGRRYVKAAEWSVGNSVIWTAVYAPTAVTWRWLPYLMVMYIAIKYIRDIDARENQAKGLISLPPDDSNVVAIHS